ncbi:MAG: hypothetical protein PHP08_03770, partial [Candidatus Dojkabacteria bacterium]|nr:hypothetical protein [Candidatus Dojkabacteria bacterium]
MIDINRIVKDTQKVKEGLLKRISEEDLDLDKIIEVYKERRNLQTEYDQQRSEQNKYNEKMAQIEKNSEEFKNLISELKEKSNQVKDIENKLREKDSELIHLLEVLPNIPEDDVVAGGKENNKSIKT